jgi:hypothetical protein
MIPVDFRLWYVFVHAPFFIPPGASGLGKHLIVRCVDSSKKWDDIREFILKNEYTPPGTSTALDNIQPIISADELAFKLPDVTPDEPVIRIFPFESDPRKPVVHYVRHEGFSRQDLHWKRLYWKTDGPSPDYRMEAGEPRVGDQCYVLLAIQENVAQTMPDLSTNDKETHTKRIYGQRYAISLDQATVNKIVRVESNDAGPWMGFDFAIPEQP